jgi:hypothetical protein
MKRVGALQYASAINPERMSTTNNVDRTTIRGKRVRRCSSAV